MSKTRIIFLGVAIGAAGLAAVLAKGMLKPKTAPEKQIVTINNVKMAEILVVKKDLLRGEEVTRSSIGWQKWPREAVQSAMITRKAKPKAKTELVGGRVRIPVFAGDPVNAQKIIQPGSNGFMAAILPAGHRAISVRITAATGAGGFILPNDRVDVLVTRKQTFEGSSEARTVTELVLSNVKVLAIDQTFTEGKGSGQVVVGKTATLELKPDQAEVLARVETSGQLTLTLRALADSGTREMGDDGPKLSPRYAGGASASEIKVFRYGVQSFTASTK